MLCRHENQSVRLDAITSEVMAFSRKDGHYEDMRSRDSAASQPLRPPRPPIGAMLREWRTARGLSQLDLALNADVSARHLSYVETGKAIPSREMVARLGEALAVPLRERNTLLAAAGYAPLYRETSLTTASMAPLRRAIEVTLRHHEPFPAFVTNPHWDVLDANEALTRFFGWLRDGARPHSNIVRQVFDPADMRPFIANWEEIAADLVRHLHAEVAASPTDASVRALLEEALAYPDVPQRWRVRDVSAEASPALTVVFRKDDVETRFFSTVTRFATPRDITLDDVRIECMYPMDETTSELCRKLSG
jgi:transcriptional regulator with XRE-family HTH domain